MNENVILECQSLTKKYGNFYALSNLDPVSYTHLMGIYFIEDPDGYWLEIVPAK